MPSPDSIRFLIIIIPGILLLIGIFRKPLYATIGYMWLVYCKTSGYYPAIATFQPELVFAIILLARMFFINNFFIKLSIKYNKINKFIYLFFGCIMVSFLVALDQQHAWDAAVYHFIKVFVLYIMVLVSVDDSKDLKIFVWSLVIMYAYLAYEPVYGFLTGTGGSKQMYGTVYVGDLGILSGHVALANNMNQMIPIAVFLILSVKKKISKIFSIIPLVIFITALIASQSRGGFVGFVALCGLFILFSKRRTKAVFVAGAAACILIIFSGTFLYTGSRISGGQIRGRLMGLAHGIEMIRVKGHVLGVGPGCFILARGKYFGHTMQSHNIYGQLMGELGIPGTVVWFLLIRQVFLNLIAAKRKLESAAMDKDFLYKLIIGLQISLAVRLIVSLGSHGLYFFYWYIVAAISIIIFKVTEKLPENPSRDGKFA